MPLYFSPWSRVPLDQIADILCSSPCLTASATGFCVCDRSSCSLSSFSRLSQLSFERTSFFFSWHQQRNVYALCFFSIFSNANTLPPPPPTTPRRIVHFWEPNNQTTTSTNKPVVGTTGKKRKTKSNPPRLSPGRQCERSPSPLSTPSLFSRGQRGVRGGKKGARGQVAPFVCFLRNSRLLVLFALPSGGGGEGVLEEVEEGGYFLSFCSLF